MQNVEAPASDSSGILGGEPLSPVEYFRQVIFRPRQTPSVNVRKDHADRLRFLGFSNFPSETLQANCIRNFDPVKMRKNQRITRRFHDCDSLRGVCFEDVTFYENPRININAQLRPRS